MASDPMSENGPTRGLVLRAIQECDRGNFRDALRLLEMAASEGGTPAVLPPRGLAAYGVSLAGTGQGRTREAIAFCRQAVKRDVSDPELHHLLAKAYLLAKSKKKAVKALELGLRVDPEHMGMRRLRTRLGVRKGRAVPFLPRGHAVNKVLGRVRHALTKPR